MPEENINDNKESDRIKDPQEGKTPLSPFAGVKHFLSVKKSDRGYPLNGDSKSVIAIEGLSGFIGNLIRKGIVTQKTVDAAVAWEKTQSGNEKRRLFQILIDEFDVDREKIFSEFANYYSFKTLDLSSMQMDAERLAFINKTVQALPVQIRQLASTKKVLPFKVSESDLSKLQIITPDPSNPEIANIVRAFPYPRHEVFYVTLKSYDELWRELTLDKQNRPAFQELEIVEEDDVASELEKEAVRKTAINQGMRTLREAGLELLKKGITLAEEIAGTTTND